MDVQSVVEANYEYCKVLQGDSEQRTANLIESTINNRKENITELEKALYKYTKPVLDKIRVVQLELGKKENIDPKKQEELKKQLDDLNTELENASKSKTGGYKPEIQKLIDKDKELALTTTKLIGYSGNSHKEYLREENEGTSKLFADTLKHGNQTYNDNGRWFLPSPILRVIKKINPFSVN